MFAEKAEGKEEGGEVGMKEFIVDEDFHPDVSRYPELVRCKDCKNSGMDTTSHPEYWCSAHAEYVKGDGFCWLGERNERITQGPIEGTDCKNHITAGGVLVDKERRPGVYMDEHGITIELPDIIRCKNCVYWQDNNNGYPHPDCKWREDETPDPDDYCSAGKRRSDNG